MPRAGDEPYAESFEVVERVVQGVNLELAAIAGASIDMANAERAAQERTNAFLQVLAYAQAFICRGRWLGSDADRCDLAQGLQHECGPCAMVSYRSWPL